MTDLHYKWTKIIASKHYGGKQAVLTPVEWQELVDDLAKQNNEIAMMKQLLEIQEALTGIAQGSIDVSRKREAELYERVEKIKTTLKL